MDEGTVHSELEQVARLLRETGTAISHLALGNRLRTLYLDLATVTWKLEGDYFTYECPLRYSIYMERPADIGDMAWMAAYPTLEDAKVNIPDAVRHYIVYDEVEARTVFDRPAVAAVAPTVPTGARAGAAVPCDGGAVDEKVIVANEDETLAITQLLQEAAERKAKQAFVPSYRAATPARDQQEEALGIALATWAVWDGRVILRVLSYALDDANYHLEAEAVTAMLHRLDNL